MTAGARGRVTPAPGSPKAIRRDVRLAAPAKPQINPRLSAASPDHGLRGSTSLLRDDDEVGATHMNSHSPGVERVERPHRGLEWGPPLKSVHNFSQGTFITQHNAQTVLTGCREHPEARMMHPMPHMAQPRDVNPPGRRQRPHPSQHQLGLRAHHPRRTASSRHHPGSPKLPAGMVQAQGTPLDGFMREAATHTARFGCNGRDYVLLPCQNAARLIMRGPGPCCFLRPGRRQAGGHSFDRTNGGGSGLHGPAAASGPLAAAVAPPPRRSAGPIAGCRRRPHEALERNALGRRRNRRAAEWRGREGGCAACKGRSVRPLGCVLQPANGKPACSRA